MLVLIHSPVKTGLRSPKSTRPVAHSAHIGSFCPFAIGSGPCCRLTAFHIENHIFAIAEVLENLHIVLFLAELWVMIRRQAISTVTGGVCPSQLLHLRLHLDRHLGDFIHLAAHSPPTSGSSGPAKSNQRLIAPPCMYNSNTCAQRIVLKMKRKWDMPVAQKDSICSVHRHSKYSNSAVFAMENRQTVEYFENSSRTGPEMFR